MPKFLANAIIFTGDAMVEGHGLLLDERVIRDIVPLHSTLPPDTEVIDCRNSILCAGLIDLQVNGGDNILFNQQPMAAAALAITAAHRRYGTTSLLLTCITDAPDIMPQALAAMRQARQQNQSILGIHLEGPHLHEAKRGVHAAEWVRKLAADDWQHYRPLADEVILATVAPETVSPTEIKKLKDQGVVVSLGHSAAAAETVKAALAAGATGFTHLYNAMSGLTARNPGMIGVALDEPDCYASLITDGWHVSDELLRLAVRAKTPEKIILVSDAMPPAATDSPADFMLYGEKISAAHGHCLTADGKLAGAAVTLAECVRHAVQRAKISLDQALRMASATPAEFIGKSEKLGKLLPGYQADTVAFSAEGDLLRVF